MMPLRHLVPLLALLSLASSQQVGTYNKEIHPRFNWTQCMPDNTCRTVNGALTIDENWRWLHESDGYLDCFWSGSNQWDTRKCKTEPNCTANCALDGSDYRPTNGLGVSVRNDTVTLAVRTWKDFMENIGLRFFLLSPSGEGPAARYQTFTLLNKEFAFDVNLSSVGCGINSALTFVEMDPDGGMERFPTNKAGAAYGTGYCDSKCPRSGRFVGGKANVEGWEPSENDPYLGTGLYGACCPEFALWSSNAHSYSMSSNLCRTKGYTVCEGKAGCDTFGNPDLKSSQAECDPYGCNYNPYRIGDENFYGLGKRVDTSKPFTVLTRFEAERVYQIFVQDGKRIDTPAAKWEGVPQQTGISPEMCAKGPAVFGEPDRFGEKNGWEAHTEMLKRPMVLSLSITTDYRTDNRWLDSIYPASSEQSKPGAKRGDCPGIDAWEAVRESINA